MGNAAALLCLDDVFGMPLGTSRNKTGVGEDGEKKTEVGECKKKEKNAVYNEYSNRSLRTLRDFGLGVKKVIY